jgi:hypothetical protein
MRETRTNIYYILIDMDAKSSELLLDKEKVPYPQSQNYFDEITIKKNQIIIQAKRTGVVDLKGIFLNHQSALFRQITKALIHYYCAVREPIQIDRITVERKAARSSDKVEFKKAELKQIVDEKAELAILSQINLTALKLIFMEDSKSHGYLYALTFLIKSLNADTKHGMFENKWKAFNAIYKAAAGATKDFDCHQFMRQHIINNPESYPLTLSKVSGMTEMNVRNNIRWIKFIHNDFSTIKQTQAFKDFVLRNEDHRLVKIIKDSLSVREDNLKTKNYYQQVVDHLNDNVSTVNDAQLAATLCIKYAYFARNKLIHAENIESGFRLIPFNKEENEVAWLSSILVLLIVDLININHNF